MTDTRTAAPAALLEPSDHHPPHPQVPDHAVTPDGRIRYHLRTRGDQAQAHPELRVALRYTDEHPQVRGALLEQLATCGGDHWIDRVRRQNGGGAHTPLRWSVAVYCHPPGAPPTLRTHLDALPQTTGVLWPDDRAAAAQYVAACALRFAERAGHAIADIYIDRMADDAAAVGMTLDEFVTETRTLAGRTRIEQTDEWQTRYPTEPGR